MPSPNPIINKSQVEIEACDETIIIESNTATVNKLRLEVVKTAGCNITAVGHNISYCVAIKNESGVDLQDLVFKDNIDPHTSYVTGSFEVNGQTRTPQVQGHEITYQIDEIEDDETVTICFRVRVDS